MAVVETRIVRKKVWGPHLVTITVEAEREFAAGQFFNLGLTLEGADVRRSYSAASAPGAPLEFFLSEVSSGALTPSLLSLETGDVVRLDDAPLGFFVLAEVPEAKTLWMVATGTGLGPYISMLREGSVLERFAKVVVVHGVRHAYQLAYADELGALATAQGAKVTYVPVLSGHEEQREGAISGRLTAAFSDGRLEARGGAFDKDCHMLLCGNPDMIGEMTDLLKARGYEKHRRKKAGHFTFEKYW